MAEPTIRILGTSGDIDKLGIFTLTAKFWARTLPDVLAFLRAGEPLDGVVFSEGSFDQDESGEYEITATYEGLGGGEGGGEFSFERRQQLTEFSFDGSMEKERIESHPKFEELKKLYKWDPTEKMFTGELVASAEEDGLNGGEAGNQIAADQIKGTDSWLVVGGEYTISYSESKIPAKLFRGVGTIEDRPRGIEDFNLDLGERRFLKLLPQVKKRGDAIEIVERYLMSGPKGISSDIYSAGQLDPGSGE